MWLLSFLPTAFLEFIINAVLFASIVGVVVGFFGSKIPFVGSYATIIKYASIVFFCIGLYWKGGFSVEKEWRARVEEMQEKVRLAEEQSKQVKQPLALRFGDPVTKHLDLVSHIGVVGLLLKCRCSVTVGRTQCVWVGLELLSLDVVIVTPHPIKSE